MEYEITCKNIKSGKTETIQSDNVLILYSFNKDDKTLAWSVVAHFQLTVLLWLLRQPGIQGLISKLDMNSLINKFLFGGQK